MPIVLFRLLQNHRHVSTGILKRQVCVLVEILTVSQAVHLKMFLYFCLEKKGKRNEQN